MNGRRDTRVWRAGSQTAAVIFLFAQTHSIQCSVFAHRYIGLDRQGEFHSSFPFSRPM